MFIEKSGTGTKKVQACIEKSGTGIEKSGTGIERSGTGIAQLMVFALMMLLAIPVLASTQSFDVGVDRNGNVSVAGIIDGAHVTGAGIVHDGYAVIPLQAVSADDSIKSGCEPPMENQGGGCTDKGNSVDPGASFTIAKDGGDESIACVPPMENQGGGCAIPGGSTGSDPETDDDAATRNCAPMENQGGGCPVKSQSAPGVKDFMWGLVEVVLDGPEILAIVYKVELDGSLTEIAVHHTW